MSVSFKPPKIVPKSVKSVTRYNQLSLGNAAITIPYYKAMATITGSVRQCKNEMGNVGLCYD
jgi:hypothetical protein